MTLLTDAELLRIHRTPERVAKYKAYVQKLADEAPPLTQAQKATLSVLLRPRTNPPNALPAPAPSTQVAA